MRERWNRFLDWLAEKVDVGGEWARLTDDGEDS